MPSERRCCQQMGVNVANAVFHQSVSFDEKEHLLTIAQVAQSEFPNNERVNQYLVFAQQVHEVRFLGAQIIDPDRRVD